MILGMRTIVDSMKECKTRRRKANKKSFFFKHKNRMIFNWKFTACWAWNKFVIEINGRMTVNRLIERKASACRMEYDILEWSLDEWIRWRDWHSDFPESDRAWKCRWNYAVHVTPSMSSESMTKRWEIQRRNFNGISTINKNTKTTSRLPFDVYDLFVWSRCYRIVSAWCDCKTNFT